MTFTKLGGEVFAGYTAGGAARQIVPAEAATWATEVEAAIASIPAIPRTTAPGPLTFYVNAALGVNGSNDGLSWATAFQTIQYAFDTIAARYDFAGYVPTIQCAGPTAAGGGGASQNYSGLNVTFIDSPASQRRATLVGVSECIIDAGGSTVTSASGYTVSVRGVDLCLFLQNMKIGNTGTAHVVYTYGGSSQVAYNGGITWLGCNSGQSHNHASRGGRIHTRPGTADYRISGGGGQFLQSAIGGRCEFEGAKIDIDAGVTFALEFLSADDSGSSVSLFGVVFSGSNITGRAYKATKDGVINLNAYYGGQSITLPSPVGGTYTTVNYPTGNGYVPGSIPGAFEYREGVCTDPGLPTVNAAAGTGAVVQGAEPSITLVLGSGATSPIRVTLASGSSWRMVQCFSSNPGVIKDPWSPGVAAPSGSSPGYFDINFTLPGPGTSGFAIQCELVGT